MVASGLCWAMPSVTLAETAEAAVALAEDSAVEEALVAASAAEALVAAVPAEAGNNLARHRQNSPYDFFNP